jgi:hypothetical protein
MKLYKLLHLLALLALVACVPTINPPTALPATDTPKPAAIATTAAPSPTDTAQPLTETPAPPSVTTPPPTATQAPPSSTTPPTAATCTPTDQDLYVYNPGRLRVMAACLRVTGVIDVIRNEADGDLHILLKLDPEFVSLLTPANQGEELGDLVIEPVCVRSVTQADAEAVCASDSDPLAGPFPAVGQHVWMEGRYILDLEHGRWAELHPLYRWGPQGASPFNTAPPPPTATRVRITFTPPPVEQPTSTQVEQIAPTDTQAVAPPTDTQPAPTEAPTTGARVRVGALCNDGTSSTATGSGACSHHGGVKCWKYSDGTCTKP